MISIKKRRDMKRGIIASIFILASFAPAMAFHADITVSGKAVDCSFEILSSTEKTVGVGVSAEDALFDGGNATDTDIAGDVVIPSTVSDGSVTYTVTAIQYSAFSSCQKITSVTLPSTVTTVGQYAFSGCSALTTADLPGVVTLEANAFDSCPLLTTVKGCSALTTIGNFCFNSDAALVDFSLPATVTTVGDYAFQLCKSLQTVVLRPSVTFAEHSFKDCTGITAITYPVRSHASLAAQLGADILAKATQTCYLSLAKSVETVRLPYDVSADGTYVLAADGVTQEQASDGKLIICTTYDAATKTIATRELSGTVLAGTGVLFSGTPGTLYYLAPAADGAVTADVSDNSLIAVDEATEIGQSSTAYGDLILSDGIFYRASAGTLGAGKAYLRIYWGTQPAAAKVFVGGLPTTAVRTVPSSATAHPRSTFYNLSGQRATAASGIVIDGRGQLFFRR